MITFNKVLFLVDITDCELSNKKEELLIRPGCTGVWPQASQSLGQVNWVMDVEDNRADVQMSKNWAIGATEPVKTEFCEFCFSIGVSHIWV